MKAFRETMPNKYFWAVLRRWRWQWLGLAILTGITVVLAILDDLVPFNVDLILLILYGLLIPFSTIWVVSVLAAGMAERAKSEADLAQHQDFIQHLEQCQNYAELTRFITKYTATLLPVKHVSLFIYDHRQACQQFAAEWNSDQQLNTPVRRYVASSCVCDACLVVKSPQLRHTGACAAILGLLDDKLADEYCQPLMYDNLLVGTLRLQCKPGMRFAPDQIAFLQLIAPEIALALALALAQPQQLTQAQLEARIRERHSLAYDLHNSLAQQASFLHLTLERMLHERNGAMADDIWQDLLQMREVAMNMYEVIRNDLAQLQLHPAADLLSAIAGYTRSVADKTGLTIQVSTIGQPIALPNSITQHIVSLLQEGLTNIERHAQARNAVITLTWLPEILTMTLADDGVGFDPQVVREGRYGVTLMRERAFELGGALDVESQPGNGARLTFQFSLPALQGWEQVGSTRLVTQVEES